MNKEVASQYFPLYCAEMYEYLREKAEMVSDKINLLVKVNFLKKNDIDSEWEMITSIDMDNFIVASSYINLLYNSIKKDGTIVDTNIAGMIVEGKEVGSYFPLRKIEVKEFVYGRDSGSPWSDPENDIRQSVSVDYYLQKAINGEWELDYDERFNFFDYAILSSVMTHFKLIERIPYEFSPYNTNADDSKIAMFEYHDHLFKFTLHISEQKCVCGEAITDYYNEYEGNNSIKVDYIDSYVFIYKFGQVLLFKRDLYMDAEHMISLKELNNKYKITVSDVEWGNDNFREWLKKNYPGAKAVNAKFSYYGIR